MFAQTGFFPVLFRIDLSLSGFSNQRSGVSKFNSALLSNSNFVQLISNVICKHRTKIANFNSFGNGGKISKVQIRTSSTDLREK